MRQKFIFIIRYGNKILVEHDNNGYRLPNLKRSNSTYSSSSIENRIKEKYALEVTGLKEVFSYDGVVSYEAYIPHTVTSTVSNSKKWVSTKAACKYEFENVDNSILRDFLGSLQSTNIKLQYGMRDGKILHVSELSDNERGLACRCTCPACEMELQARIGTGKRRPHFSHHKEACNIASAQQTALHLLAKEILEESHKIMLPAYILDGKTGDFVDYDVYDFAIEKQLMSYKYKGPVNYQFDKVILEERNNDIIPDVLIWDSSNGKKLIIEVAVTHFVDDKKRQKIIEKGISALEIDISQLHNREFNRSILKEALINSIDSKRWIHNTNYEKALLKISERNKEISTSARKLAEARRLQWEKEAEELREQLAEKEKKRQQKIQSIKNVLEKESYSNTVATLRNDQQVKNHFKLKRFFRSSDKEIPFFLDIPVTGQIAFTCDRRIWQMELFEFFIYKRNTGANISIIRIWKWFTTYAGKKMLNWDLIIKNDFEIGNKKYRDNLALDAIKQYLSYLGKLGFIEYYGDFIYRKDYEVISKTIVPPNTAIAKNLELVFNSVKDNTPTVDSDVDEVYNHFFPEIITKEGTKSTIKNRGWS